MGHHRLFRRRKKSLQPSYKTRRARKKRRRDSNIVNIDEERNLVFGFEVTVAHKDIHMCGLTA